MGVLRHGQDDAIALLRRFPIMMISVVMLLAAVGVMPGYCGRLLQEMMHPVRRGSGEKKPKRSGDAQVQAALEFRE